MGIEPNLDTGEASFEYGIRRYTLALTHLAWATAQRAIGMVDGKALSRPEILRRIAEGFDLEGYALFFGMLQKHHPEIVTLNQAAELMESCGEVAVDAVRVAMGISAPDPRDERELTEGERPPKAQAKQRRSRTNASSISEPVSLA